MLASIALTWGLLGISCGGLVILAVILSVVWRGARGMIVVGFLVLGLAATAFLFVGPRSRPVAPRIHMPELPDAGAVEAYVAEIRAQREQVEQRVGEELRRGAEAVALAARGIGVQTQVTVLEPLKIRISRLSEGPGAKSWVRPGSVLWSGVTAFAVAALLYLGYLFLDASTRGQFTWSLRIVAVFTFGALFAAISVLRSGL